jgi:hypothetical protein
MAATYAAHWRERLAVGPVRSARRLVLELTGRLARLCWVAIMPSPM